MAKRRKYTFDLKLELVSKIVDDGLSISEISRVEKISRTTLTHWVHLFNIHGEDSLKWKKIYNRTLEEKIDSVLRYRQSNLSLSQASAQLGLGGAVVLANWHNEMKEDKEQTKNQLNKRIEASTKALGKKVFSKHKNELESKFPDYESLSKDELVDTLRETLAELAYLKKLKALALLKLQDRI